MILSLEAQAQLFLLAVMLGGFLGFAYDCLRIFRKIVPHKLLFLQIQDALFWLVAILFVFGVLLQTNFGEIRFFVLLGIFLGMVVYFLTLSFVVMAVSGRVIWVVGKVLHLLISIILTPFRLLFLVFGKPLMRIARYCVKKVKNILQIYRVYAKIGITKRNRNWRIFKQPNKKCGGGLYGKKETEKKNNTP